MIDARELNWVGHLENVRYAWYNGIQVHLTAHQTGFCSVEIRYGGHIRLVFHSLPPARAVQTAMQALEFLHEFVMTPHISMDDPLVALDQIIGYDGRGVHKVDDE